VDIFEAILNRKVRRAFADRPIEPDKLGKIINAGRHAMSARNLQPWQFVVIHDRGTLREIGSLCSTGRFVADAPSAIVVLKDTSNTRWADVDCAQAVQNMATAAWGMDLGTCWVGNFDGAKIATLLGVPDGWAIFTILPFGYARPGEQPQTRPLKPRAETMHYERYGRRQHG